MLDTHDKHQSNPEVEVIFVLYTGSEGWHSGQKPEVLPEHPFECDSDLKRDIRPFLFRYSAAVRITGRNEDQDLLSSDRTRQYLKSGKLPRG